MISVIEFAQILNVTDLTVRRMIKDEKLAAKKLENGMYEIEDFEALRYVTEHSKYQTSKALLLEHIAKREGILQEYSQVISTDIEVLNAKITENAVAIAGTTLVKAFNDHLRTVGDPTSLSNDIREIENKLDVRKQPSIKGMVDILEKVVSVKTHDQITIGQVLNGDEIEGIFGRNPKQEGINFCTSTKELFIITKLGIDNPAVEFAEYNDYWKFGKIFYEGKGQNIQEFKGSNLHLYRKVQVYRKEIQCKDGVPSYIHVFNKISNTASQKFQYLGMFNVTDFMINEHSAGITQETKTAIVYELTPIVDKVSNSIDENYIF